MSDVNKIKLKTLLSVMLLTLLSLPSCSYVRHQYGETCKTHAYVKTYLPDYISTRYPMDAQVRMAVIPFSIPANLSNQGSERPGMGENLARMIHSQLLAHGEVPIVEVFNRKDWPSKKEEFFTGNFGAISISREAGYDLVMVGMIETMHGIDSITAYSKVIEPESGTTLWYGETTVSTRQKEWDRWLDNSWLKNRRPDQLYLDPMANRLAECIVKDVLKDEYEPSMLGRYWPF